MNSSTAFDNICSLPLPSDLFAQALHPSEPIFTVGLSSGHVQTYRLPPVADVDEQESEFSSQPTTLTSGSVNGTTPILSQRRRSSTASENGLGAVDTVWKTRRHKGSCRALSYNHDGSLCYSAGTDGLVKCFESETGRVVSKIAIPGSNTYNGEIVGDIDAPSVLYALSPQALLLGTDSGHLYLFDIRLQSNGKGVSARPSTTWTPHEQEHVNGLVPLPASDTSTSGFPKQWVSVGGTTLTVTDLRKGVVATSEDQETELTSVIVVQGLKKGGTSVGEKVLVGQSDGVVSLWERGVWGDLDERIVLDRTGAGVDCLAEVPTDSARTKLRMNEKVVAAGLEDGRIRFMRIGRNGVLSEWDLRHDEIEGVVALGFDAAGGRMISGGGAIAKVWTEAKGGAGVSGSLKREFGDSDSNHEDDSEADFQDSSDEDDDISGKRKKRKRNKGKDKSGGQIFNVSGIF